MINVEQLLDTSRVEVAFADIKIDKDFVRRFKEKHSLSSVVLANIFGVTKKTVEKWETGEKDVSGSAAVLFKVLDDNPEIIRQLYTVKVINKSTEKKMEIPKEYMFQGDYEKGGWKKQSPVAREMSDTPLSEIACPRCGKKRLEIADFGDDWYDQKFQVACRECDWRNPTGTLSDYGETVSEFKFWLEAFELLGRPAEKVNEDLTLYFYPEGEWREKEREERENDAQTDND